MRVPLPPASKTTDTVCLVPFCNQTFLLVSFYLSGPLAHLFCAQTESKQQKFKPQVNLQQRLHDSKIPNMHALNEYFRVAEIQKLGIYLVADGFSFTFCGYYNAQIAKVVKLTSSASSLATGGSLVKIARTWRWRLWRPILNRSPA